MRRIATAFVAVLALCTGVAGIVAADARRAHDRAGITITAVQQPAGGDAMASYEPGTWNRTVFVLLVGSDERAGLEGARGDALHVIGLNPGLNRATIIDIPRDTWVDVPGHGQGRINTAYQFGGPQLQAETVRRFTGAPISYVINTTFAGFKAMVDAIGGVNVQIPYPMDDKNSGAAFGPGLQRLNGSQALAFSRNRHIPDGDLMRTAHQGQLIIHALTDLRAKGTSGTDTLRYLDILYRNVRTVGIGPTDLFRLGRAALAIPPGNVRNFAMPARVGMQGKLSVVFAQPVARSVFADFADDGVLQQH
ncbi:MAG: transcriptional attenuator, LytR family [Acidimicrobiales bacterium]|nr:transcriptional attenuator, LytR family [Acidimicrobiales bacterium]